MGATNDKRVSRNPERLPDYSRDETVQASLDALFEEDSGSGYSEPSFINNVFVSEINTYTDDSKTELRSKTTFTYPSPTFSPFVESVTKEYFKDGSPTPFRTITATITYNANKTVQDVDVEVT